MSSLKHVGGIAAAMTLVGCVLLVDPIEVHEHCTVKTSTSCGACIARNCQVDVDACCGDRSCSDESSMLGVVNQCAVGDARLCGSGLANPSFGVEESVRSCLVSSCQAECLQGSADGGPSIVASPTAKSFCGAPRTATTDCGRCVFTSCGSRLDECCEDSSCKSAGAAIASDVGHCVSGDAPACAYATKRGDSGLEGVVRACIVKECGARCLGDGRPHAKCSPQAGGKYCSCADSDMSGGPECSVAKVGGQCVVADGACTCGSYGCTGDASRCSCDFRSSGGTTSCLPVAIASSGQGACCLRLSNFLNQGVRCECEFRTECYADLHEIAVATCSESDVLAALRAAKRVVTSCSK